MKAIVAIDSFKGSISATEAGNAVKVGILRVFKDAVVDVHPLADGGEGTVNAIVSGKDAVFNKVSVSDPLGKRITANYAVDQENKTAFIEMSAAAGITLIDESERNPLNTTTYGVGEMIKDAISKGYRKFIVGIGGSATNDGGIGMLEALGFEFLNSDKKPVKKGADGLEELCEIKTDNSLKELCECEFHIACDVKNPLCGENGCSAVYGPQKGATLEMIKKMDKWLENYAGLTKNINKSANSDMPGTGAAGGMGFAFSAYLNATLESGIDLIIKETGLEEYIKNADIVITGEGRLDGQTDMGKAPTGVAKTAKKYNKPVLAFSGAVTRDAKNCNNSGIDAFFPITRTPCSLSDAMDKENALNNMADTVEQVFRLIKLFKNNGGN